MKVWLGTETGLLKGVALEGKKILNNYLDLNREKEITCMSWGFGESQEEKEKQVFVGHKDGVLRLYATSDGSLVKEYPDLPGIVAVNAMGKTLTVVLSNGTIFQRVIDGDSVQAEKTANSGAGVEVACVCAENGNLVATGGKENDLKIWDFSEETPKLKFHAKNVPHDKLDLRVPVHVSGIGFLPGTQGNQVFVCTKHRHLRLYDTSKQRRPMYTVEVGEHPFTALTVIDEKRAIVSDGIGTVNLIQIKDGKPVGKLPGFAGSVRALVMHPHLPLVASCGLDRFVRVHNINTRRLMAKVYTKHRLNALLFESEGAVVPPVEDQPEENTGSAAAGTSDAKPGAGAENEDNDDVWDGIAAGGEYEEDGSEEGSDEDDEDDEEEDEDDEEEIKKSKVKAGVKRKAAPKAPAPKKAKKETPKKATASKSKNANTKKSGAKQRK
eukprot:Colp12_sorted_trinity150504_noHs@35034